MKNIILLSLFCLPFLSKSQEKFTITGKVGYNNAAIVILSWKLNGVTVADTAKVKNGSFFFTGTVPKILSVNLDMRYYTSPGFNIIADNLPFYLENTNITISSRDYLKNSSITGSPVNDDYAKLKDHVASANASTSIAQSDVYAKYALANTNKFMGLVALSSSMARDVDESQTQSILDKFSPELKASSLAKYIQSTIDIFRNTKPGGTAIAFTQNNEQGLPVSLADFKGKYVLIDFWASWCGPCRKENPNLVATYNLFKNKNFTVLGVSLDRSKELWLKAIKDDRLNWPQVSDLLYWDNAVAKLYAIKGIPTNILVGPDGKIAGKNLFGPQLAQRLNELLSQGK